MIGQTILHYKILAKLGEGGMGVVYLAEDINLERKVAIKFLPHSFSITSEDKERFKTEARAAAALNHPNISTIHSIEETENDRFIVMEYVEGKELKDIVETRHGVSLQINDIINYSIQIAEGLDKAHKKGIIHRDIKSSNIMITDENKVKIMDFGLAKMRGEKGLTKTGTTVGTAAYMSPEQVNGKEADKRSDIWSFGIVLYEMITHHLPFQSSYDAALFYSIINDEPEHIDTSNREIPDRLLSIVNRCLEKDPEKRFSDFGEILSILEYIKAHQQIEKKIDTSLRHWLKRKSIIIPTVAIIFIIGIFLWNLSNLSNEKVSTTKNGIMKIAVLPFNNIKNDPKTNFLGFALADQIIGSLAYDNNIVVRPASSVRQYQNEIVTAVKAGKALNVNYILDGTYLKDADQIRLSLELVNVKKDEIVWRNEFDEKYVNTFKLQDLVSQKVTSDLKVKFASNRNETEVPTNPKAYEYYLKAISYTSTFENAHKAISLLEKAISLDSTFAPAYVELGVKYDFFADFDPTQKGMVKASEIAFLKALSLDNNSLSAMSGLAGLYVETGRPLNAVKLLRRALKINPNNPDAHFSLGYIFRYTGLQKSAIKEMEKAIKLDPHGKYQNIGVTYIYSQRYEDALKGLGSDTTSDYIMAWKGQTYLRMHKMNLAKKYLLKAINIKSGALVYWAKIMLDYIENKKQKALSILNSLNKSNVYDGEVYYNTGNLYALLGDVKDCNRLLNKAIDHGFFNYKVMSTDPFLDSARNDPEFKRILQKAKRKSEEFKNELIENSLLE